MTLEQFKQLNKDKGLHWFSKDSVRFFKSRVSNWDYTTGLFISSERSFTNPRRYTIRKANFVDGNVKSVSEFQQYSSLNGAKGAWLRLLRGSKL